MKEVFEKIWLPLNTYWKGTDKKSQTKIIIIASVFVLAIIIASILLGQDEYVVLYKDMEQQEAGEVLTKLEEMKVDAKPTGDNTILVPKDQADTIRMQLSAEGYPKSSLNYDIFENSMNFGATDFEKQKYLQFQLQERLQNSIETLDIVKDAIVTLNIPDNSSFVLKDDKQKASASVIINLKNKDSLSPKQIKGIEGLISKSVPGLNPEEVFIIDSMGNSLKSNANSKVEMAGEHLELEGAMSNKLQDEIVTLLEPVFGVGNISAGVRVSLDFDEKTTESLSFDPADGDNGGIAVSESTASEELNNGTGSGNVGLDANGGATQYAETDGNGGQYKKENRTVNYEVNQIRETVKKAEGYIKDISVSVLLDDENLPGNADKKVKEIVSGLGIAEENIVVQKMAFNAKDEIGKILDSSQQASEMMKKRRIIYQSVIFGAGALVLAVALWFILRRKRKKYKKEINEMPNFDMTVKDEEEPQLELKVKSTDKRTLIENSIRKNPELVALLLRNWLREDVNNGRR